MQHFSKRHMEKIKGEDCTIVKIYAREDDSGSVFTTWLYLMDDFLNRVVLSPPYVALAAVTSS